MHSPLHSIGPVSFRTARHIGRYLVILLVKLVDLYLALTSAMGIVLLCAPALPIDFTFEFEHRRLLLLADGDRGRPIQLLYLINFDRSIGCVESNGAPFLFEVLLGELCIVLLFPMPVAFVPDGTDSTTLCLYHVSDFLFDSI